MRGEIQLRCDVTETVWVDPKPDVATHEVLDVGGHYLRPLRLSVRRWEEPGARRVDEQRAVFFQVQVQQPHGSAGEWDFDGFGVLDLIGRVIKRDCGILAVVRPQNIFIRSVLSRLEIRNGALCVILIQSAVATRFAAARSISFRSRRP